MGNWSSGTSSPDGRPRACPCSCITCHLGVYRRALALDAGGFRSQFDGCQDYDFVLRLAERTDQVAHIPRILYHWRAHAGSSASGDQAKPYAYLAQPGAIAEHLRRSRIDAEIQFGHLPGVHRVVHRVTPSSSVDLVLALTDEHGLTRAAVSWLSQPHPTWRVVLAASPHVLLAATTALTAAASPHRASPPSPPIPPPIEPPRWPPPPTPRNPSTCYSCRPSPRASPTTG